MVRRKRNTRPERRPAKAIRAKAANGRSAGLDSLRRERMYLIEQLSRVSECLKVAEQERARVASENVRLMTENSLLRARLD